MRNTSAGGTGEQIMTHLRDRRLISVADPRRGLGADSLARFGVPDEALLFEVLNEGAK